MRGSRVLVTGAGGFIGSHLVEALAHAGAKVRAVLRYTADGSIGNLSFLPGDLLSDVELVYGDLADPDFLRRVAPGSDVVFHLGALVSIPHSFVSPRSYFDTNIGGTLNVLEALRTTSDTLLVHVSSSEVYGSAQYSPMDEAHPLQAQSPYAASKTAADQLVMSYGHAFGVRAVIVRPFNTYGPRQSPRAIVPAVIMQALESDLIKLGALSPTRDMTFVTDTVGGMMAAATSDPLVGGTYNLGTGKDVPIGDLVHLILEIMGSKARVQCDSSRMRPHRSEVSKLLSSNQAFRQMTGWEPAIDLVEGLRRTIAFYKSTHGALKPRNA